MALFSTKISCFNWWKRYQFYVHFCCCLSWPYLISVLQCKLIICNVMLLLNCKSGLLLFLLLLVVTPIAGFCICSMFYCALHCVHSSFAIISGCFALFVCLVSWVRCGTWLYRFLIFAPLPTVLVSHCCVAFPHNAIGLSAVCDCGISWSYHFWWNSKLVTNILLLVAYVLNISFTADST